VAINSDINVLLDTFCTSCYPGSYSYVILSLTVLFLVALDFAINSAQLLSYSELLVNNISRS